MAAQKAGKGTAFVDALQEVGLIFVEDGIDIDIMYLHMHLPPADNVHMHVQCTKRLGCDLLSRMV